MEVFQTCQIDAGATFIDFVTQAVETFFQQQREVYRQVCVAGGHVTFGFDNTGFQQPFLLISEHPVAAILHGLTTPPWAHLMQYTFVLFAYRKACARSVGEVVDLFFNPRDGVFRENRRGTHFACLVTNDQFVMFDPDGAFRQMMG